MESVPEEEEEEEACDFCSKPLRKRCEDAEECSTCGTKCADCHGVMCCDCFGDGCGYCSDPAGWKKYYCKEHEEPKCAACGDTICHYCNTYPSWCEKPGCEETGPYHDSTYGISCYKQHRDAHDNE